MIPAICFLFAAIALSGDPAEPMSFTDEQKARISKLANVTKQEADRLKDLLDQRQRALAGVYDKYALDEEKANKLETDVLDLQRQMLANHRKMQVELRTLVSEQRFLQLRRRLENMLKTPTKAQEKETRPMVRP